MNIDNEMAMDNTIRTDKRVKIAKELTLKEIQKSASLLKKGRAAYGELIDFYEELFLAQEESKKEFNLDPIIIETESLKLKLESGMPLIDSSQFTVNVEQAEMLLERLCKIAQNRAPKLEMAASAILLSLMKNSQKTVEFKSENLFTALIQNNQKVLQEIADAIAIKEEELIFFGFAAIAPAIQSCAIQLSHYLEPESSWVKGYCPVCGNLPQMAFLNEDGEKHLICGFCLHSWKTSRMGCAICQNREKEKQHYFYNEEEKEYRVDLCDHCGKYIKLIDLRELTRDFYPRLELLCTLHLDIQATEQGYAGVGQSNLSR